MIHRAANAVPLSARLRPLHRCAALQKTTSVTLPKRAQATHPRAQRTLQLQMVRKSCLLHYCISSHVTVGKGCGSNGMACASGQCTSVNLQCQTIGASMNLQNACPNQNNQNCQVSCQDPTQSNQCVLLQSELIDGSPCGKQISPFS